MSGMSSRHSIWYVMTFVAGMVVSATVCLISINWPPWSKPLLDIEDEKADNRSASGTTIHQAFRKPQGSLPLGADGVELSAIKTYLKKQPGLPLTLELKLQYRVLRVMKAGSGQPSRWLGHYQYAIHYRNLPVVKASRALLVVASDPVFVRDRNIPTNAEELGPPEATVSVESARQLAVNQSREAVAGLSKKDVLSGPKSQGSEKHQLVIWVDKQGAGHLAWELLLRSSNQKVPFQRRYWVAARDKARILDYENLEYGVSVVPRQTRAERPRSDLLHADRRPVVWLPTLLTALQPVPAPAVTRGKVTGTVWASTPLRGIKTEALSHVEVLLLQDGKPPVRVITNKQGEYVAPGVTGNVHVSATLTGPYARILNDQEGDSVLQASKKGNDTIDLDFLVKEDNELNLAKVSTFYWINEVRDFAEEFLPQSIAKLNRLKVSANNTDPDVPVDKRRPNANYSWENTTLTLDRGAGVFPNRASRDVVIHEYGHALDDEWGVIQDRPYSEGFADALVILMTRQAIFGMDWMGKDTFLRKASDQITWEEVQEEPEGGPGDYKRGRVYSGFVWDLISQLKKQHPEEAAYQVARQLILGPASCDPKDIPDAVRLSFLYDAQQFSDGAGKKSKHFDALAAAATSRKLPIPPDPLDRNAGLLPN